MELIKTIMIQAEDDNIHTDIEGYTEQEVLGHQKLLIDAGFLDGVYHMNTESAKPTISVVHIKDITWQGYDLLELLQDEKKFEYLKSLGKAISLELLKEAIKYAKNSLIG